MWLGPVSYYGQVFQSAPFSVLARVTSLDGSGGEVQPGEGSCLQQVDVSSITCKVFNLGTNKDATEGAEITPDPTLTVAGSILNTLRVVGWSKDLYGYNFRHDIGALYDALPGTGSLGNWYQVEHMFTLTGGGIIFMRGKVKTVPLITEGG